MANLAKFNVLILDDNPEFHNVIESAVHNIGLKNVRASASVSQAQKMMLEGFLPDLIVMEINLDGFAGLNFIRQIRAGKSPANPDVLIVIMSKVLTPKTAFRACEIGFEHFLRKPFSADAVEKRVRAILKNPRRFVVGDSYFGPDRRDRNVTQIFEGLNRRKREEKPSSQTILAAHKVAAPSHFPSGVKSNGGGRVLDDIPETLDDNSTLNIPCLETSVDLEEPLKGAAKSASAKSSKSKKALRKQKQKGIEIAEAIQEPGAHDRSAEIAAKLAAHSDWLNSHGREGEKADFADDDLSGMDFSEANLAKANLRNADLQDANFLKANLFDANLRGANMSGANLEEADLHNANLRHATLKATMLLEAGLRGADLAGANLQGAFLAGADFKDVNFLSTNICGADMLGGNLTQKQIDNTTGDPSTKLPAGIRVKVD